MPGKNSVCDVFWKFPSFVFLTRWKVNCTLRLCSHAWQNISRNLVLLLNAQGTRENKEKGKASEQAVYLGSRECSDQLLVSSRLTRVRHRATSRDSQFLPIPKRRAFSICSRCHHVILETKVPSKVQHIYQALGLVMRSEEGCSSFITYRAWR